MRLGIKVASIPCLIILLMSTILYSLSIPQTVQSYPVSIEKIGLKWASLYLTICIFNGADQKYEDIFIKAVEEWKQAWPHFNYQLANTGGCSIDVEILKDYAPYQEGGYLGTTQPTPTDHYDNGYWDFANAKIIIPSKNKFNVLQGGICCNIIYLERTDKEFYETAVHEFGHALGLGHSRNSGNGPVDIMNAALGAADAQYIISSMTIKKLDEIYGTSTTASDHPLKIQPTVMIEVKTDKDAYYFDGTVHVSGKVSKLGGNGYLMMIYHYQNVFNVETFEGFDPNRDGSFSADLDITTSDAGEWLLLVQYLGVSSEVIFEVKEIGYEIHAYTDKATYSVGDVVKINGNVTRHGEGVDTYLINPKGINFKFVKAPISSDKNFEARFTLQESDLTTEGIWTIHMTYAGASKDIHFNVVKATAPAAPAASAEKEKPKSIEGKKDLITVNMKDKKRTTLLMVKNNGDKEISSVKIKASDGSIRFVKAKSWDREKLDPSTVLIETKDNPLSQGANLLVILVLDNKVSGIEWTAFDSDNNIISSGILMPK